MTLSDRLAELSGEASRLHRLGRGEALFHRGDQASSVFVVERGRVRLLRHGADGGQVVAGVAHAGMTLGEAALYSATYHCDAFAETAATVRSFRAESLRARLRSDPDLAEAYSRVLVSQLQEARTRLELSSIRRASDRIEAALAAGVTPTGPRSLAAFAAELGLAPETLYRALRRLEEGGRIRRRGSCIEWRGSDFELES